MIYLKFGFNIVLFMFVIGRMLCPHLVVFTVVRMFILIECSSLIASVILTRHFGFMISWCLNNDLRGSGGRSFKTVARNTGHNDTTN